MPQYVVTIGGKKYRVNSPSALTPAQAYQIAQTQAGRSNRPEGQSREPWYGRVPERSTGTKVTAQVRQVGRGVADIPDMLAAAGNFLQPSRAIDAIFGTNLTPNRRTDLANAAVDTAADAARMGRVEQGSRGEQVLGAGVRGAAGALVPIPGLSATTRGGKAIEAIAGALGGSASEEVRQEGYGLPAQILAGIAAGTIPVGVLSAGRGALGAVRERSRFARPNARAAREIQERAGNAAAAAASIDQAPVPTRRTVPTTAEVAQSPGLAALQRERASDALEARMRANAHARAATASTTLGPGNPQAIQDLAQQRAAGGERAAQTLGERVGDVADAEASGIMTRAQFTEAHQAAKRATRQAYREWENMTHEIMITPEEATGVFDRIKAAADDFYGDAGGHAPAGTQGTIYDLLDELGKDFTNTRAVANVDRRLADLAGELRVKGRAADAAFTERIRGIVDTELGPFVAPETQAAAQRAKDLRRVQAERFEQGRVGRAMGEKRYGEPNVSDPELIGRLVVRGDAGLENANKLIGAVGQQSAERAVREHFRRMVDSGTVTDATLRGYEPLLKRFPKVRDDIQAMLSQRVANTEFAASPLGGMADQSVGPTAEVTNLLNAKDEGRGFANFVGSIDGNPEAMAGARRSLSDYITTAMSKGEKYDASGAIIPDSNSGIKAIQTVLDRSGALLSGEQRSVLEAIQRELKSVSFARSGGVTQSGRVEREIVPAVSGRVARTILAVTKHLSNREQVSTLIDQALLDPKFAAELLRRPVKDRVARVLRTLRSATTGAAIGAATGETEPVPQPIPQEY